MSTLRNNNLSKYMLLHNGNKLKKAYHNGTVELWSAGDIVTYCVDTGITYKEEVDYEASCFPPKTFTPTKDGWIFVGWREDTTASGDVLTNKVMGDNPIILYAVFKKTITISYNGNNANSGAVEPQSGTVYYNNGNVAGATFTMANNGFSRTNHAFKYWTQGSTSGAAVYPGSNVTLSDNTVFYAYWVMDVPDKTMSVSISYNSGDDGVWADNTPETIATVATGIDTSLYSGAELTLSFIDMLSTNSGGYSYLYFTDGTNNAEAAYDLTNASGENHSVYRTDLTPTINFSKSSGTIDLKLTVVGSGTTCILSVTGGSLKLIGRKG